MEHQVGKNPPALRAAVFLSSENLKGCSNIPKPVRDKQITELLFRRWHA